MMMMMKRNKKRDESSAMDLWQGLADPKLFPAFVAEAFRFLL